MDAHEAWDLLTGLTCKYRNLLLSTSPCLPTGRWGGTVPSFTQIWLSFVFWVKAIVALSFKVCFVLFFTPIPIPLCSLLSLCGRGSSSFCVVTVLNIEHKKKRDTQAKASFWYSNYEQSLGLYNSKQVFLGLCKLVFIENLPNTLPVREMQWTHNYAWKVIRF